MARLALQLTVLAVPLIALCGPLVYETTARPYSTSRPHQAWHEVVGGAWVRVIETVAPTVLAEPQLDCDCTESKPWRRCGPNDQCTAYVCEFTGNLTKLCQARPCQPPCNGAAVTPCTCAATIACRPV